MLVTPIPSQCFFEQRQQLRDCPDTALHSENVHQVRNCTSIRPRPPAGPHILTMTPDLFHRVSLASVYLLFITLSLLHIVSSCPNNFPGGSQSAVLPESVCHHQVTRSKATVVTVLEIRGLCTRLTFSFFLPSLELQAGHMEVLQRQQESQSM